MKNKLFIFLIVFSLMIGSVFALNFDGSNSSNKAVPAILKITGSLSIGPDVCNTTSCEMTININGGSPIYATSGSASMLSNKLSNGVFIGPFSVAQTGTTNKDILVSININQNSSNVIDANVSIPNPNYSQGYLLADNVANNAITTSKLANSSVTSAKLSTWNTAANGNVLYFDSSKSPTLGWKQFILGTMDIADGSITTSKLADGAVTSSKILDNSIQGKDIADSTISYNNIKIYTTPGKCPVNAAQLIFDETLHEFTWSAEQPCSLQSVTLTGPSNNQIPQNIPLLATVSYNPPSAATYGTYYWTLGAPNSTPVTLTSNSPGVKSISAIALDLNLSYFAPNTSHTITITMTYGGVTKSDSYNFTVLPALNQFGNNGSGGV